VILCDGVELVIGGELHCALRRLRCEEDNLRIWVDALCINQDDVEGRNEQVKVMGRIYQGAERVRIWLGEESGIEARAVQVLGIARKKVDAVKATGIPQRFSNRDEDCMATLN